MSELIKKMKEENKFQFVTFYVTYLMIFLKISINQKNTIGSESMNFNI